MPGSEDCASVWPGTSSNTPSTAQTWKCTCPINTFGALGVNHFGLLHSARGVVQFAGREKSGRAIGIQKWGFAHAAAFNRRAGLPVRAQCKFLNLRPTGNPMNNEFEASTGNAHGITMVLTALIQSLTPVQAAQAALELKMAHVDQLNHDADDQTSQLAADSRDAIVDAYLGLLSSVAKRG